MNYTYDYNVRFANGAYERRFFSYLSNAAKPAPLTDFQKLYNGKPRTFCKPPNGEPKPCQRQGVRDIKKNYRISASSVEKWLAANPPAGIDTKRNTVFFINWWGDGKKPRKGFKHHVYTKTNEPDPDTDFNFGRRTTAASSLPGVAPPQTTRRAAWAPRGASGSTTSRQDQTRSPTTGMSTTPISREIKRKTTGCLPFGSITPRMATDRLLGSPATCPGLRVTSPSTFSSPARRSPAAAPHATALAG